MYIKIHEAYRRVIALADSELIGKTFTEGMQQIEVRPNFFKGEEKNKKETIDILQDMNKEDATFFIVGKESIQCALNAKIISQKGAIEIEKVPVALGLF